MNGREADRPEPRDPEPAERPEDISSHWITAALRHAGLDVEIAEVAFSGIGTGQMADSFRFELSHGAGSDAPSSVVVKMQAADELSRQAGSRGAYEAEVRFYTELAPTLPSKKFPRAATQQGEP